jgi:hypothetical protein
MSKGVLMAYTHTNWFLLMIFAHRVFGGVLQANIHG